MENHNKINEIIQAIKSVETQIHKWKIAFERSLERFKTYSVNSNHIMLILNDIKFTVSLATLHVNDF
jgi:hypothetical protein